MAQLQLAPMRVLIVEDSITDAHILQEYLRLGEHPPHAEVAVRLSDALALARQTPFDAVLLDMSLPDAQGAEAVHAIRSVLPGVPIVILSGEEDEHIATLAVQAGAQDYLIKRQVDDAGLRRALRHAIERQQLLEQLARSQARLHEENAMLRRLTDAAGRVFAALDVRAMVDVLASE
ncbi:MAG: response regulator, partial [Candidatus Baltobacteraceae bacterium]